ncbi:Arc family DNA-binding protein [Pseudomonas asiatica]|uniref:Arc family DNA-binding protein n=1 Tax=Pseudomonas asiatica TaxID=2219225 RepID=UPI0033650927
MMTDRHVLPPYSLRMTAELRDQLEASAGHAKRSLNAEIVARLEDSFRKQTGAPASMGQLIDLLLAMGQERGIPIQVQVGDASEDNDENGD